MARKKKELPKNIGLVFVERTLKLKKLKARFHTEEEAQKVLDTLTYPDDYEILFLPAHPEIIAD